MICIALIMKYALKYLLKSIANQLHYIQIKV